MIFVAKENSTGFYKNPFEIAMGKWIYRQGN
jgi:hypothetical protein